jgi:hypothetical protein
MRKLTRIDASRPPRLRLAAAAAGAPTAVADAIAAGQSLAAPARDPHRTALPRPAGLKQPKPKHGLLRIEGTNASDTIALRLQAGRPDVLQVDVGDDRSADSSFRRADAARIAVDGTAGDDAVMVSGADGTADVAGDAAAVHVADADPADDTLTVDALSGEDVVDASGLAATSVGLEENGGDDDTLIGSTCHDLANGGKGADVAFLGTGDDTFVWNPGDGSDLVEGDAGSDTMVFNGANAAENVVLSANGNRLLFTRDAAGITVDTHGVETVDLNALGGADTVTVDDLSGTDVTGVNVDLAGALDGAADRVVVNGTSGTDAIVVGGDAARVKVSGLAATIDVLHAEAANDRLELDNLAGRVTADPAWPGT